MFTCHKFLHNLTYRDSKILVKANQKTQDYLNDMRDSKRQEYLDYLAG